MSNQYVPSVSTPVSLAKWKGSPSEAITAITELISEHRLYIEPPTERTLRDWRNDEILSRHGRKFTERNLLEAIRAKQLRDRDLPVLVIKDHIQGLSDAELLAAIQTTEVGLPASKSEPDEAERTVILLAHGVLKQFRVVQEGGIVGRAEQTPLELRQAQAHLARLYIQSGLRDEVASVHELLTRCKQPLCAWAPPSLAVHERYADAVLIDPEYCVPSEDCQVIAELGGHLEDLVETQLHDQLMCALERLDETERPGAYTLIRRFIAEHPLATCDEYRGIRNDPHLTDDIARFFDKVYQPAHAELAIAGVVRRCGRCQCFLRSDGLCALASCRYVNPRPLDGTTVQLVDAFVARSEILKYWCDPAQEELRLYRELLAVYGDRVRLYPHLDRCDVSLDNDVGVDVKDYRDPARLARKLNRGLGGLRLYPRMILAVATRRAAATEYLPRLKENLLPALRQILKVESVDNVIKTLKKESRRD